MRLYVNLQKECVGLLGTRNPCIEQTSDGKQRAMAPFLIEPRPAYLPEHLPQADELPALENYYVNTSRNYLETWNCVEDSTMVHFHLTHETSPGNRIMKMFLANRPAFHPGSSLSASGDGEVAESPSLKGKAGQAINDFTMSRVLLEQSMLTAGALQTRRGGESQNDSKGQRQRGEGPLSVASVPSYMMTLAMKQGERTRLDCELGGDGTPIGFRTASQVPNGDAIVWADFYNDDFNGPDTPDGQKASMLSASQWTGGVTSIRPYISRGRYQGPYAMSNKRRNRDTDFTWQPGKGDDVSHETLTNLLSDYIDYKPEKGWVNLLGDVAAVSSDTDSPEENDIPLNDTHLRVLAQSPLVKQAIELIMRDLVVSLVIGNRSETVIDKATTLWLKRHWFDTPDGDWNLDDLNTLKIIMCCVDITGKPAEGGPALTGVVSLADPLWNGAGSSIIQGVVGKKLGDVDTSIATTGRLDLTVTDLGSYVDSIALPRWSNTGACFTTGIACYQDVGVYPGQTRAFWGQAGATGSWRNTAEGRYGTPAVLHGSIAKCRFAHLPFYREGDSRSVCLSVFGGAYDLSDLPAGFGVWWVTGDACGIRSTGVVGLFEDGVDRHVSEWDNSDEFFVTYITNCQGGY